MGYAVVAWSELLPLTLLAVAAAHLGGATVWVFSTVRLQQLVPNHVMGRVFALEQASFTVMMALCTGLQGIYVDWAGGSARGLAAFVSIGLFVMAAVWGIRGAVLGWPTGLDTTETPTT